MNEQGQCCGNQGCCETDMIEHEEAAKFKESAPPRIETHALITVGQYEISPHATPDGQVWIEIQRIDDFDSHDHSVGPSKTVVVDELFQMEPSWAATRKQ